MCLPRCDRRDEAEAGDAGDREARGGLQVREPRSLLLGGAYKLIINWNKELNHYIKSNYLKSTVLMILNSVGAGPAHQGRHVRQEHGAVGQCNIQAAEGEGGGEKAQR